jgi:uncharacterized protein
MIMPAMALAHLSDLKLDDEATELFLSANSRAIFKI